MQQDKFYQYEYMTSIVLTSYLQVLIVMILNITVSFLEQQSLKTLKTNNYCSVFSQIIIVELQENTRSMSRKVSMRKDMRMHQGDQPGLWKGWHHLRKHVHCKVQVCKHVKVPKLINKILVYAFYSLVWFWGGSRLWYQLIFLSCCLKLQAVFLLKTSCSS